MSNTDSFIDEVTEEVRKDQLFGYFRRYGWIAVLVVLLLVGGTAFSEFRKAQATGQAEEAGNAILAALELDDDTARAEALAAIEVEGEAAAIVGLLQAANLTELSQGAEAVAALDQVALQTDAPEVYRDLAALKAVMQLDSGLSVDERRASLETLAAPGAPFRLIAQEQLAYLNVEAGEIDLALEQFGAIALDADVTRGLRDRAFGMIVALDGDVDAILEAFATAFESDQ